MVVSYWGSGPPDKLPTQVTGVANDDNSMLADESAST